MKKNHYTNHSETYAAPMVTVAEFTLEQGFALSGTGSAGWEDGDKENDLGNF